MIKFKTTLNTDDRSAKFKKNSLVLLLCQLLNIGLSLLLVPLTLKFLGVSEYGIWITLVGLIEWFNFFDIGLGHGLRNKYAEAKANNNEYELKKYVSTAFFMMVLISVSIFLIFILFSSFLDWSIILNSPATMRDSLQTLAVLLIGIFCLRFIINIVSVLLTADQNPAIPAIITLLGGLLSLISIYYLTIQGETSLVVLGFFLSFSQLFPLIMAFIYFFSTRYKTIFPNLKYFSKPHIRSIFSLGIKFFLIQITALLLFQSNNIIIAHVCGLSDVTKFNIAFKYLSVLSTAFMTFLTPLWSATTDAYTRGDIQWIERTIKRLNKIWLLLIILGIGLVGISPFVYKIWLKDSVEPDFLLLFLILLYFIFLTKSNLYRSFMNGVGKIKMQFVVTLTQAIIHIPLTIILGKAYGIIGVVLTMVIWNFINSIWEPIQYNKIIKNTAHGLWAR